MQRARRLVSIAVIAALGLGGLTACRSQPGVAAYVGDRHITEERVERLYNDALEQLTAAIEQQRAAQPEQSEGPEPTEVTLPITRQDIVVTLVGADLLGGLVREKGLTATPVAVEQVVQQLRLPPTTEFAQLFAEYEGYVQALVGASQPVEPSEADLRDVYDRLAKGGGFRDPAPSFEEFVATLGTQDRQTLSQSIGLRDEVFTQVQKVDATVNPRYAPAQLALVTFQGPDGQPQPLVVLPFEAKTAEPAVINR
ncbi:SurA N-terminal domain-containing protein [Polymorphospora rubra]|uniref:SurA N-terminal domain-containing protein n=1 Tax=Polymorphospora rubra TaxID=338584 RepID=UPI0033CF93A6